jgi:hypothetical protein
MTLVRLLRALVLVAMLLVLSRALGRSGATLDLTSVKDAVEQLAKQAEHAIGLR